VLLDKPKSNSHMQVRHFCTYAAALSNVGYTVGDCTALKINKREINWIDTSRSRRSQ